MRGLHQAPRAAAGISARLLGRRGVEAEDARHEHPVAGGHDGAAMPGRQPIRRDRRPHPGNHRAIGSSSAGSWWKAARKTAAARSQRSLHRFRVGRSPRPAWPGRRGRGLRAGRRRRRRNRGDELGHAAQQAGQQRLLGGEVIEQPALGNAGQLAAASSVSPATPVARPALPPHRAPGCGHRCGSRPGWCQCRGYVRHHYTGWTVRQPSSRYSANEITLG